MYCEYHFKRPLAKPLIRQKALSKHLNYGYKYFRSHIIRSTDKTKRISQVIFNPHSSYSPKSREGAIALTGLGATTPIRMPMCRSLHRITREQMPVIGMHW